MPARAGAFRAAAMAALGASLAVVVVLGGCGRGEEGRDASRLDLALETEPSTLDPARVVDVSGGEICSQLFQGLVAFDPEGKLVPAAARSWDVSADGTRYVFHLDPRMRFSNGRAVSASDVVFSFRRVLSPASPSPRQWVLDRIRGAPAFSAGTSDEIGGLSAPDDSTVVVELARPFAPFLAMLALPAAMIVPREALGASGRFAGLPSGSGAWRLADWKRGNYLSLVPNPYNPRASSTLSQVRYRVIPEAFTRVAEFESGTLDILTLPPTEIRHFLDDPASARLVQRRSELRVYYIGLNNQRPPFDDVRVRRALNMAVDVDRMIQVLASGEAVRATGAIPPTLPGYERRPAYPYDPDAARRLLAEAGYPDGFAMEIWLRESPQGNRIIEAVQGYLAQVGIRVRLVRREWTAFKGAVTAGRVDAFLLDWFADYPDGENFLYPLFHSSNAGGGGNRARFRDAAVDSLIQLASRTVDGPARTALYARIDGMVYREAPWIYLYFPRSFQAVSERVSGYRMPTLYLGTDFTSVTKESP